MAKPPKEMKTQMKPELEKKPVIKEDGDDGNSDDAQVKMETDDFADVKVKGIKMLNLVCIVYSSN